MSTLTMSVTEARSRFSKIWESSRKEPVLIKKRGTEEARVMITEEEYNHYEALSDAYWLNMAEASKKNDRLISGKELEDLVKVKLSENA